MSSKSSKLSEILLQGRNSTGQKIITAHRQRLLLSAASGSAGGFEGGLRGKVEDVGEGRERMKKNEKKLCKLVLERES